MCYHYKYTTLLELLSTNQTSCTDNKRDILTMYTMGTLGYVHESWL